MIRYRIGIQVAASMLLPLLLRRLDTYGVLIHVHDDCLLWRLRDVYFCRRDFCDRRFVGFGLGCWGVWSRFGLYPAV